MTVSFTPGLHFVELERPIEIAPFWMLALEPGTETEGLLQLERSILDHLGIKSDEAAAPWTKWTGSFFYRTEDDCRRAALEMMRRRPDLRVFVLPSSPDYGPMYSPLDLEFKILIKG